eukprot:332415-Prorocentrum_lima.AAC.1
MQSARNYATFTLYAPYTGPMDSAGHPCCLRAKWRVLCRPWGTSNCTNPRTCGKEDPVDQPGWRRRRREQL